MGHEVNLLAIIDKSNHLLALQQKIRERLKNIYPSISVDWLNRKSLVEKVNNIQPDLTIVIRGENLKNEIITKLRESSVYGCINIYPDSPYVIPGKGANFLRKSLREYSRILTFSKSLIPVFLQLGCSKVSSLPFAYCPNTHKYEEPIERYKTDVAYFGAWGPIQEEILKEVDKNFSLNIYGPGWSKCKNKKLAKCYLKDCGTGSDMSRAVSSAKIVLNFVRSEHGCFHSMKTFEIPACGGVVLTNYTEEQAAFFKPDKEVFYFSAFEEVVPKIKSILKNYSNREAVRLRGMEAVKNHTYKTRIQELINIVKNDN